MLTRHTPLPQAPSLLRRLAALGYDSLLVLTLIFIITAITVAVHEPLLPEVASVVPGEIVPPQVTADTPSLPAWQVQLIGVVTGVLFYSLFWFKGGQTLGMQTWRLRIDRLDGTPPSLLQCVQRALLALVSAAPLGLGYWWALIDPEKRTWHDRLSGTHVVLLPKASRD